MITILKAFVIGVPVLAAIAALAIGLAFFALWLFEAEGPRVEFVRTTIFILGCVAASLILGNLVLEAWR